MKLSKLKLAGLCLTSLILSACAEAPVVVSQASAPEKLIIHSNGSMEFRNRVLPERDVVIYDDGYGGEKAAVRVRLEPLHPDFFRDSIIVERMTPLQEDQTAVTQN